MVNYCILGYLIYDMSLKNQKKLVRYQVGAMPLIQHILACLDLKSLLAEQLILHGSDVFNVDRLILLISNLAIGKMPLYKLDEWVASMNLRSFGYKQPLMVSEDEFGQALDKLYQADHHALMGKIVSSAIKKFHINLAQIHNDATTIKYDDMGITQTEVELKKGDHLKLLAFNLSISAEGGVPIHYQTYPGSHTDDTLFIESWNTLVKICQRADFLYVTDSKYCTDAQLHHIVTHGGKVIALVPNTWNETQVFKEKLRKTMIAKTEIGRNKSQISELEYFSVYSGDYFTEKRGYRLHWFHSSEKKKRDHAHRKQQLQCAEKELTSLVGELNTKQYKTREAILRTSQKILKKY